MTEGSKKQFECAWVGHVPPGEGAPEEYDRRLRAALLWTEQRSNGRNALVLTPQMKPETLSPPVLQQFAARHARTSTRGADRRRTAEGPTLLVAPDLRDLDDAYSRGTTHLCAIEWPTFPLRGWAAYVGAHDFAVDAQTPPIDEDTRRAAELLAAASDARSRTGAAVSDALTLVRKKFAPNEIPALAYAAGLNPLDVDRLDKLVAASTAPTPIRREPLRPRPSSDW